MDEHIYHEIRIPCPIHDTYYVTHGCSFADCHRDILFCSACFLEHLDHANEHKDYIFPLEHFIDEFYLNIQQIKDKIRPFEEINSSKMTHLSFYNQYIFEQKENINNEIQSLIEQFSFTMEKIKLNYLSELDQLEKSLVENYETLSDYFKTTEINHLGFNHPLELAQKLVKINPAQAPPYLENLRHIVQSLGDPSSSLTVKNLIRTSQIIQSFKRGGEKNALVLNQTAQASLKQVYSEIDSRLRLCFQEISKPVDATKSALDRARPSPYAPYEIIDVQQKKMIKSSLNSSRGRSPGPYQGSRLASPPRNESPNTLLGRKESPPLVGTTVVSGRKESPPRGGGRVNSSIKRDVSPDVFNNTYAGGEPYSNQGIKKFNNAINSLDFLSQKNAVLRNNHFFNSGIRLTLSAESFFDSEHFQTTLCVASLGDNLIATAGKDNLIRVFRVIKNLGKTDMKLLSILQYKADPFAIWSLTNLVPFPSQSLAQGGHIYLAAGTESGNIYVWKLDLGLFNLFEYKPINILKGNTYGEITTTLLDLEECNHLVTGDSNGTILLWDYLFGKTITKFNFHTGQINSLVLFNNKQNFAAGGYDGGISIWTIYKRRSAMADETLVEINCIKMIRNEFYVYSLVGLPSRRNLLAVVDSQRRVKILDTDTFTFKSESESLFNSETIFDALTLEVTSFESARSLVYLFCFTKNNIVVMDVDSMKVVQILENPYLLENNIGLTMSSNHKVVYITSEKDQLARGSKFQVGALDSENGPYFALVDQSNKTIRIVTVFRIIL